MLRKNPLTYGKRKPYLRIVPPLQKLERVPVKAKVWRLPFNPVRVTLAFCKAYPHIIIISGIFIFLFAWNYLNLITFVSLGFFCLILSDHLVDIGKKWYQNHHHPQETEQEKLAKKVGAELRAMKLDYFTDLAKKRSDSKNPN